MPDVLSAQDAAIWWVQSPDAPLWIGAVAIFEAGPLRTVAGPIDIERLRRHVAGALDAFPRFRQRLITLPLGQGLAWIDDERFEVADHVHLIDLPVPGGAAELRTFVGTLLELPVSSARPLWDLWVVDGLEGDRVALIPQANHARTDGMALIEFALSLLSFESQPGGVAHPDEQPGRERWKPTPQPNPLKALVTGAVERTRHQVVAIGKLAAAVVDPKTIASAASGLARAARSGISLAADLPITRPVGTHRNMVWTALPWDELGQVKRSAGVTLNDVLLAIITGAVAHYLHQLDESRESRRPRLLIPVSAPHPAGQPTSNSFEFFLTDMPVATEDPLERLRLIHADTKKQKGSTQAGLMPLIFSIADLLPPAVLRAAAPPILRHQPFANTVVTNMPGSRDPLYLLGSRMTEVYPFICGIGNLAVVIGVVSYGDQLGIGITVDPDLIPDVDVLVEGVQLAAAELLTATASENRR